jgi:hypothetical protein
MKHRRKKRYEDRDTEATGVEDFVSEAAMRGNGLSISDCFGRGLKDESQRYAPSGITLPYVIPRR